MRYIRRFNSAKFLDKRQLGLGLLIFRIAIAFETHAKLLRHECIAGPGQGQQAEVDIKHTGINQHRHAHDQGAGFGELMPLKATPQEIHAVHKQRQGNKGGGSPLDGNRSAGKRTEDNQVSPAKRFLPASMNSLDQR